MQGEDAGSEEKERIALAARIVIRPLRANDLETLYEPMRRSLGAEWIAKQERGEMYVAVAEVDGVPIGQRCLDFTTYAEERIGWVFGAWVVPEWRRRGIALMIDHHLEHVALARGFRAFRSSAAKHNAEAVRLHERLGDRVIGNGPVRWKEPDGSEVEVDVWTFERTLGCTCDGAPRLGPYSDSVPEPPKT